MGKLKTFLICAAALCCPIFICSGSAAGNVLRDSAYWSVGVFPGSENNDHNSADSDSDPQYSSNPGNYSPNPGADPGNNSSSSNSSTSDQSSSASTGQQSSPGSVEPVNNPVPAQRGTIIVKNRSERKDDVDWSSFKLNNGRIYRYSFERGSTEEYIDLISGAQVQNKTEKSNLQLIAASKQLPPIEIKDPTQPTVLIYHTHTTESYMPNSDRYDTRYPNRSVDSDRNMIAVGDAICEALAQRGISVVHDCTVHDNPEFVGAYNRSAETILQNLEEYPSIKIVLDIHRDGIANPDGSLVAPIAEINGKNAAQFMIISGCDGERFSIPNYMDNFKLACLLQNTAEELFPGLARPVLFDYRDYNQSLFTGTLLIEVGSHGNCLEETTYTGQLIGEVISKAVEQLKVGS